SGSGSPSGSRGTSSHDAALAVTCSTPSATSGLITRSRNRSVPVPAPDSSSSGGVALTWSDVDGPQRSSSFWPGAGAKGTSRRRAPAATSVAGRATRCAPPSSTSPASVAGSATRVSRCAADSTTSRCTVSSVTSTSTPDGSASPRARVVTSAEAGTYRRPAALYVPASTKLPSGSTATPSEGFRLPQP